jgi:hypothetical protein
MLNVIEDGSSRRVGHYFRKLVEVSEVTSKFWRDGLRFRKEAFHHRRDKCR